MKSKISASVANKANVFTAGMSERVPVINIKVKILITYNKVTYNLMYRVKQKGRTVLEQLVFRL